jgi:hypothetical protein
LTARSVYKSNLARDLQGHFLGVEAVAQEITEEIKEGSSKLSQLLQEVES